MCTCVRDGDEPGSELVDLDSVGIFNTEATGGSYSKGARKFCEGREGLGEPGAQHSRHQTSRFRDPEAGMR